MDTANQIERAPRLALVLLLTLGWAMLLGLVEGVAILPSLGLYSALVAALLIPLGGTRARQLLKPGSRDTAVGLLAGVLMVLLTYPTYALGAWLISSLRAEVAQLYQVTGVAAMSAIPTVLVIVAAEELLFRGAVLDALRARWPRSKAAAGALVLYMIALGATRSWIVLALGFSCGVVWLLLRLWTRGLWAPILTHAIWSTTVFVLYPLE